VPEALFFVKNGCEAPNSRYKNLEFVTHKYYFIQMYTMLRQGQLFSY
jgi:hypothetical protein